MRYRTIVLFGTSILISVILVACSGDGAVTRDAPNTTDGSSGSASSGACSATSASIQTTIFRASCDGVGCHGSSNPAAGLDLVDISPDKLGSTSSALCPGWSLIVPGSPEKSFLYQKLTATKPTCGDSMPLGKHLADGDAKCIADWISSMATGGGCETCGGKECVALASDAQNCGACGNACPAGIACENGACSCAGGGQACDGTCVDVQTDAKNCGKCGNACAAGSTCVTGVCSCPQGLDSCAGSCVDVASNAQHCGACDRACAAKEVCLMGKCSAGCGSLTQCGSSCVDTQTSLLNCGACDKACAAGLACKSGKCECENGGELCGTACVDTQTDAANCGGCGMKCGAGEACSAGACQCSSSGAVSFKNDVAPILSGTCTSAGCHAGMKPKENLSLETAKSFGELVNVATSECSGSRKLVVPGSPGTSYLMQKLLGVDICTGTQMPKAGSSLPQKQLDLISGWICAGAPNN
ncbi:MAG TPA: hypothetical protein VHB79_01560 [Polyangiaceae bacterium]|nr:hypothetical protein [Polyangiaceae bacterium]